jgi:TolB-like protein/Tfp pilus assembly protein PilF
MSSIIPGFEYDIFISYRQKDNRGEQWVSEFVEALKNELESTFKEEISVYFDINPKDGLLETHDVEASLRSKLKCLVFIPVLSQTYCDPKSYAWQYEFCAFNRLSKEDEFGREIRLASGNVGSRILPVKIHDLDIEDNATIAAEYGAFLRYIELIYKAPGVNRPLRQNEDHPQDNLNKTYYRDQINKVANAIKEIIAGMRNAGKPYVTPVMQYPDTPGSLTGNSDKSIIVLPFENFSPDAGQEYFSDGLTEEIITDLSQVKDLLVISRSSAMSFKGARKKVREIANEVNVNYVLEGSVRKAGNSIRITVQLIDAFNDAHIWADKYTGSLDDVFIIQEKVSRAVVDALKVRLTRVGKKPASSLKAYELYLLGRYYWNKRTEEGIGMAIRYFEEAIELDNCYAPAYAGLADAYFVGADWNYHSPAEAYKKAAGLAQTAILLDNNISEAYATAAGIADNFEYDYAKAESLYKAAIRLNPNYATGYQWYADYQLRLGMFDEALKHTSKALQLDPLSAVQNFACGTIHYYSRNYDSALLKFDETLNTDPAFPDLRFMRFLCHFHKGRLKEAIEEYLQVLSGSDRKEYGLNADNSFRSGGIKGYLEFIIRLELNKPEPSSRYLAVFNALAGNVQKALDYIEHNVSTYVSEYQYLNVEPAFTFLRSEPRFIALVNHVGYKV